MPPNHPPCPHCGSTAGPEHPCPGPMIGKILDNRYQIESVLGMGGMGMVFRATQVAVKRAVALKTLHPSLAAAPQFFERFRREAEVASRLRHPNIVTIFDFGKAEDGTCYFVMELVPGDSLKQLVKSEGPLSLRRAVNIIEQAARGLGLAHAENVVHRDVKPHNLLISQVDGQDFVKLLDFGLVKAMEQEEEDQLTSTGQVLGTPQYMPPEQAGGEEVDARSDLYSLAGVLYFCLTGSSPFGANTVRKALSAAITGQVPPVHTKRRGAPVPRELDGFFRKGLAAEREDRHQTAEEFLVELREALQGVSDAELDARPEAADPGGGKEAGSGSEKKGKPGSGSSSRPSKGSNPARSGAHGVIIDSAALGGGGRSGPSKARVTQPEIPSARGRTPPPEVPPPAEALAPIKPAKVIAFGVIPVLLIAAGGAVLWQRSSSASPAPTPIAVAPPVVTAPPVAPPSEPTTPPLSATVTVKLRSVPDGAEVFDGDVSMGKTPVDLALTRDRVHALTFRMEGYGAVGQNLDLARYEGSIRHLDVELPPAAKGAKPATATTTKKKKGDAIPVFE